MPSQTAEILGSFPETNRPEIEALQQGDWGALDGWYLRYKAPLIKHLRRRTQLSAERAESLFQDFLSDKIVGEGILKKYDFAKRKEFRNWIITVFVNYVLDRWKKDKKIPPTDPDDPIFHGRGTRDAESSAKDKSWRRDVLEGAAKRLKVHFDRLRSPGDWELFMCRVFRPAVEYAEPLPFKVAIKRFGIEPPSEAHAHQRVFRAREKFDRFLYEIVREHVRDEHAVELEVKAIRELYQVPRNKR